MKLFALLGLGIVGAIVVYKHHAGEVAKLKNQPTEVPSGVSVYSGTPAPQTTAQILASQPTNSDAVSEPGFSPAFGSDENQPGMGESLW